MHIVNGRAIIDVTHFEVSQHNAFVECDGCGRTNYDCVDELFDKIQKEVEGTC
jgi:hypothetical protein